MKYIYIKSSITKSQKVFVVHNLINIAQNLVLRSVRGTFFIEPANPRYVQVPIYRYLSLEERYYQISF